MEGQQNEPRQRKQKKHSLLHGNPVVDGPSGLLHVPLVHEHRRRQQLHRGVVARRRVAQPHLEGSDDDLPIVGGRQIPRRKPHRLEGRGGVVLDLSAIERVSRRFAGGGGGRTLCWPLTTNPCRPGAPFLLEIGTPSTLGGGGGLVPILRGFRGSMGALKRLGRAKKENKNCAVAKKRALRFCP